MPGKCCTTELHLQIIFFDGMLYDTVISGRRGSHKHKYGKHKIRLVSSLGFCSPRSAFFFDKRGLVRVRHVEDMLEASRDCWVNREAEGKGKREGLSLCVSQRGRWVSADHLRSSHRTLSYVLILHLS